MQPTQCITRKRFFSCLAVLSLMSLSRLALSASGLIAWSPPEKNVLEFVNRYTLTGKFKTEEICNPNTNKCTNQINFSKPIVKRELGRLTKTNFSPIYSSVEREVSIGEMNDGVIPGIYGKFLFPLGHWLSETENIPSFKRSIEIYTVGGVPHVAVSRGINNIKSEDFTLVENYNLTGNIIDKNCNINTSICANKSPTPVGIRTSGRLFEKTGYIPTSSRNAYYSISSVGMDINTAKEIDGKSILQLEKWNNPSPHLLEVKSKFSRSAKTFTINGVPYIIVKAQLGVIRPRKPIVNVSVLTPKISEKGLSKGYFLIFLNSVNSKDFKVTYAILGTAKNSEDYKKIENNVIIPAGTMSTYVNIEPIDDNRKEPLEDVTIKITKSSFYNLGASKSAAVTISDND